MLYSEVSAPDLENLTDHFGVERSVQEARDANSATDILEDELPRRENNMKLTPLPGAE